MEPATLNNGKVDVVNYLAILSLERIGIFEPTEKEIDAMETILLTSINQGISFYSRKIKLFKKIPQLAFSMLKKKRKYIYEKQYVQVHQINMLIK